MMAEKPVRRGRPGNRKLPKPTHSRLDLAPYRYTLMMKIRFMVFIVNHESMRETVLQIRPARQTRVESIIQDNDGFASVKRLRFLRVN